MVRAEKKILLDKLNELMFIFEVNTHNEEIQVATCKKVFSQFYNMYNVHDDFRGFLLDGSEEITNRLKDSEFDTYNILNKVIIGSDEHNYSRIILKDLQRNFKNLTFRRVYCSSFLNYLEEYYNFLINCFSGYYRQFIKKTNLDFVDMFIKQLQDVYLKNIEKLKIYGVYDSFEYKLIYDARRQYRILAKDKTKNHYFYIAIGYVTHEAFKYFKDLNAEEEILKNKLKVLNLTPRQLEILNLFLEGLSRETIKSQLCISENTMSSHVNVISQNLLSRFNLPEDLKFKSIHKKILWIQQNSIA